MSTSESTATPQANLSPSASFASELMARHMHTLLQQLVSHAAQNGYAVTDDQARRFPDRLGLAMTYVEPRLKEMFHWLFDSRETSNFTYSLNETNIEYLSCFVSTITATPRERIREYIRELEGDRELKDHVLRVASSGAHYIDIDQRFDFGRRLGWYAVARAIKPRVIVETGVEQGLGSLVLTAALRRNAQEGAPGIYRGTDINPQAGYLFQGEYRDFGTILYGDSIESLRAMNERIDLFINDSDHSADYESREYETIASKLADRAIVLGDNSHVTDRLYRFALQAGKRFLFFQEKPRGHWYPGAGIGAAY